MVGSFKQHSIEGLRANRARMKERERERELDAPISYNKTTRDAKKDDATKYIEKTIWKQNKRLFLFVPSRSPRPFRIGPFQTLLYYSCFIRSSSNLIIKSQNTNKICVQCDE